MAVVNTTTTAIASADATGAVRSCRRAEVVKVGTVGVASGDSISSTLRLIRVPSNMRITSLELSSDAIRRPRPTLACTTSRRTVRPSSMDQFGSAVSLGDRAGQDQRAPRSCARRHLEDGSAAVAAPGSVLQIPASPTTSSPR